MGFAPIIIDFAKEIMLAILVVYINALLLRSSKKLARKHRTLIANLKNASSTMAEKSTTAARSTDFARRFFRRTMLAKYVVPVVVLVLLAFLPVDKLWLYTFALGWLTLGVALLADVLLFMLSFILYLVDFARAEVQRNQHSP